MNLNLFTRVHVCPHCYSGAVRHFEGDAFQCDSCGQFFRNKSDPTMSVAEWGLKTAGIVLGLVPAAILLISEKAIPMEYFWWLNGIFSWLGAFLVLTNTVKNPILRIVAAAFVGVLFFGANLFVAFFVGCSRMFR